MCFRIKGEVFIADLEFLKSLDLLHFLNPLSFLGSETSAELKLLFL